MPRQIPLTQRLDELDTTLKVINWSLLFVAVILLLAIKQSEEVKRQYLLERFDAAMDAHARKVEHDRQAREPAGE